MSGNGTVSNGTTANGAAASGASPALPDAGALLARLGAVSFAWDLASDAMCWGEAVTEVLAPLAPEVLATGSALARQIEPTPGIRSDAVLNSPATDNGAGVRYAIEYGIRTPSSSDLLWVEETGCWFAGHDGRPARVEGLVRIISERHARDEQLRRLASHDPLTGELNRTHLLAAAAETLEEAARFHTSAAFLLLGIDDLDHVNDAFGFDVADEVIIEVARRIRARLRGADVLARASGNKFGVILKNCTADEMAVAAERFLSAIRNDVIPTSSGPVAVTASIGAIAAPRHARTVDDVVTRAQEALAIAKRRRRGSYHAWRPNAEREAQRRVNIRVTDEIVSALNDRRLVIAYEPIAGARDREIAYYECLVRMRQEDGTLMLAPDIVPVAERLGLIRLVDQRVLELVIEDLAAAPQAKLSLNISPETTTDPEWWARIETLLPAHPGVAERLIVEITETAAIQDVDDVRGFVTRLKNFGARIAIDDFGAGNTSFRNLRRLGVDLVKIDGAFVQNIVHSADDRAFVQTLLDLARRLGIKTVAEWVQDEEAAALLRDWGCDYLQGRLIGLAAAERPWCAAHRVAGRPLEHQQAQNEKRPLAGALDARKRGVGRRPGSLLRGVL
jgi:diguanylate cyclase (GGDEF)-like protein